MNRQNTNQLYISLLSSDDDQQSPSQISSLNQQLANNLSTHLDISPSSNPKMPMKNRSTYFSQQKKARQGYNYTDVSAFKQFKKTISLTTHFYVFKNFIETSSKNVLFVFGPSGCGKKMLVQTCLTMSEIPYQRARGKVTEDQDGQLIYPDIYEIFQKELSSRSMILQKVVLFDDYPILNDQTPTYHVQKYKRFKEKVYETIKDSKNRNKYIFILNSQIYNPYYILLQNSEKKALKYLPNVSIIRMEAYGKRQLKAIIQHFLESHPAYASCFRSPKDFDQIIIQAEGDARKALNLIYYKKVTQQAQKHNFSQKSSFGGLLNKAASQQQSSVKMKREYDPTEQIPQQKVSIFHMLGKFLYGKRLNINYDPNLKKKAQQISAYYTEQQLIKHNPKFYFRPVPLLQRSRLEINKFTDLLQENFIHRYGKVKDIVNMYSVFRYYDSYLGETINRFEIKRQMQQNVKELLTWGIIIYNKNTVKAKQMFQFQRSKYYVNQRALQKKLSIIRTYYLKKDLDSGILYRMKDMLNFAYYTKQDRYRNQYTFMHQKLIELVFDNSRSHKMNQPIGTDNNVMQTEDEQEVAQQACQRVDQLQKRIIAEVKKRKLLMRLVEQQSDDGSDIDSD